MIFAASAVPSATQTMNYVLGPGRDNVPDRAELLGGQGLGFEPTAEDVKLATQIMEYNASPDMQASRTKKCTLTALHASASWEPSQRADQDEMLEAGRHFLKSVGMENSMALFVKHSDKRPHMHMVASLIDPKTGLTYGRYQFLYKAQHAAIEWERERNQITPARQPQHDLARAARDLDWERLQDLLRKKDGRIAYGKVNHALALGGHFGSNMVEHGVQFKQYLEAERDLSRQRSVEREQIDWAERLGFKDKTPDQLRAFVNMTRQQSERFEQTINDPIDSKRHDKETLSHYAEQARIGREGMAAAEKEPAGRGEPERTKSMTQTPERAADKLYETGQISQKEFDKQIQQPIPKLEPDKEKISIRDFFAMARNDDVYGHVLERTPKREKRRGLDR